MDIKDIENITNCERKEISKLKGGENIKCVMTRLLFIHDKNMRQQCYDDLIIKF